MDAFRVLSFPPLQVPPTGTRRPIAASLPHIYCWRDPFPNVKMAEPASEGAGAVADGSHTNNDGLFIPLHSAAEPFSHSADANTYLAHQKIPVLLEWLSASVVQAKPAHVLYHIRNVVAAAHCALVARKGHGYSPVEFAAALEAAYTRASDSRGNDNEIDDQGRPVKQQHNLPPLHSEEQQQGGGSRSRDNINGNGGVDGKDADAALQRRRAACRPPRVQSLTMTYFSHRGRGDLPWMLAALSGVPYDIHWITWDAFSAQGAVRDTAPFLQLPVLHVNTRDGVGGEGSEETVVVAQTLAIARFLANIAGFLPRDPADVAAMDSLVAQLQGAVRTIELLTAGSTEKQDAVFADITSVRLPTVLRAAECRLGPAGGAVALSNSRGRQQQQQQQADAGPQPRQADAHDDDNDSQAAAVWTRVAGESGGGSSQVGGRGSVGSSKLRGPFLCGDELSWGDLALFAELDLLLRWGATAQGLLGKEFPRLLEWQAAVAAVPAVKDFVNENWEGKELRW